MLSSDLNVTFSYNDDDETDDNIHPPPLLENDDLPPLVLDSTDEDEDDDEYEPMHRSPPVATPNLETAWDETRPRMTPQEAEIERLRKRNRELEACVASGQTHPLEEPLKTFTRLSQARKHVQAEMEEEEKQKRQRANLARERATKEREEQEREIRENKERLRKERHDKKVERDAAQKEKTRRELQDYAERYADNLFNGTARYIEKDYFSALTLFNDATRMLDDKHALPDIEAALVSTSRNRIQHLLSNIRLIDYLIIRCTFEADKDGNKGDIMIDKLAVLVATFRAPFVYWLYGRTLNRYRPHSDDISKLLRTASINDHCDNQRYYLTDEYVLAESEHHILCELVADEVNTFQRRPEPDAFCRHSACTVPRIYFGANSAAFYARITCHETVHDDGDIVNNGTCTQKIHDCVLVYHKSCWRNLTKKRYLVIAREACIGLGCPFNIECNRDVIRMYEELNGDGSVRGTWGGTKSPKTKSPAIDTTNFETEATETISSLVGEEEIQVESSISSLDYVDEPNITSEIRTGEHQAEREIVSAYSIDLRAATVLLPQRDRDDAVKVSIKTERQSRRLKKNKVKATMSLGEFFKDEEEKEAERALQQQTRDAKARSVDRVVKDMKKTLTSLSRRPTKNLAAKRAPPAVPADDV